MNRAIRILHLEDSEKDSELILSVIEGGEISFEYFLTDTESAYINKLDEGNIDIILSDFSLPDYDGYEALRFAKEHYPTLPFIFVSGKIEEDAAIKAMVNGATDYVFKNKLERLVPAINRALREFELESGRKMADIKLDEKRAQIELQNEKYILINKELAFQNDEKEKRADELIIANKELAFQNNEKNDRAAELIIADKELGLQQIEKDKRASELIIANKELVTQNKLKEKRAAELIIANKELHFQNKEKEKRANELIIANKELALSK
jgi:DNA-binding response OmpR family regulator